MGDLVDDALRRLEPGLRRRLEEALRSIRLPDLEALITEGNLAAVAEALKGVGVAQDAVDQIASSLVAAQEFAIDRVTAEFDFRLENPRVREWAQVHAANLVVEIDGSTRQAIRDLIDDGLRLGKNPRALVSQISQVVGLTSRDAGAVARLMSGIEDLRRAERMGQRYANRLLRRRAENIARTEMLTATHRGQLEAWRRAADEGIIDRTRARRVWIVTPDERLCSECAVMRDQTVGFSDPFVATEEAAAFGISGREIVVAETRPRAEPWADMTPPLHPSCRCRVELTFGEVAPNVEPETALDWRSDIESPRGTTKYGELLDEAQQIISGSVGPRTAAAFRRSMQMLDDFQIGPRSSTKGGVKLASGTFGQTAHDVVRTPAGRATSNHRMWLSTVRNNDEWYDLIREGRYPRGPADYTVGASADDIAATFLHELTHLAASEGYINTAAGSRLGQAARDVLARVRTLRRDHPYLSYAASDAEECAAELVRQYHLGVGSVRGMDDEVLSAVQWRRRHPELAEWVEREALPIIDEAWGEV